MTVRTSVARAWRTICGAEQALGLGGFGLDPLNYPGGYNDIMEALMKVTAFRFRNFMGFKDSGWIELWPILRMVK